MRFQLTFITGLMLLIIASAGVTLAQDEYQTGEFVLFYPAYGYFDEAEEEWIVPMRIYVYEQRPGTKRVITSLVKRTRNLTDEQADLFSSRINDFIADSESRETVLLEFERDPERVVFSLQDEFGEAQSTNLNGIIEGEVRLSAGRAGNLMQAQNPDDGWLTIRAVSGKHSGTGVIKLVPPEGLSVISDVDDTAKITEIPAGSSIVIRNTFYKEFSAAPGMAERYQNFGEDVFFHYVSGAPWQLFRSLSEFLFGEEAGFPGGTFHMKSVTKNLLSMSTWRDLQELVLNEDVTFDQKVSQISQIFEHFPRRRFILVGDSGEADPEVFREIRRLYPGQVQEIYIRDVVNAREENPERLGGMNIIPAPAIVRGVSLFDEAGER